MGPHSILNLPSYPGKNSVLTLWGNRRRRASLVRSSFLTGALSPGLTLALIAVAGHAKADEPTSAVQVNEVVVTAQRFSSTLQRTPIAMSNYDKETLSLLGVKNATDLSGVAPGLDMPKAMISPSNAQYFIRGIGVRDIMYDPSVGIYVDDVYIPRSYGANTSFPDLERVEVLRGPQGTLFGQNNNAGAIRFFTEGPDFRGHGHAALAVGSYGQFDAKFFATDTIGQSGNLAGSISLQHLGRNGYTHNVTLDRDVNNLDQYSARGKLRFKPNARLDVMLEVDGAIDRSDPIYVVPVEQPDGIGGAAYNPRLTWISRIQEQHLQSAGASIRAKYDLSDTDHITAIVSHRGFHGPTNLFFDGGTSKKIQEINDRYAQHDTTGEITFTRHNEQFDFAAGVFLLDEILKWNRFYQFSKSIANTGTRQLIYSNLKTQSYAAYAQANYKLAEQLTLVGGLRYTWQRRDFINSGFSSTGPFIDPNATYLYNTLVPNPGSYHADDRSKGWGAFSPKIAVEYTPSASQMAYLSYSQGFRSGTFDIYAGSSAATLPVAPETVDTFELGSKSSYLNGRVSLNIAIFYNRWHDYQISAFDSNLQLSRLLNGGEAKSAGEEFELTFRPTDDLILTGSANYLDSGWSKFTAKLPSNIVGATTLVGKELPFAPKWTLAGTVQYRHQIRDLGLARLGGNISFQTRTFAETYNVVQQDIPALTTINLNAGIKLRNGLDFDLRVTNLLDQQYNQYGSYSPTLGPNGSWYGYIQPPRMVSATVTYEF